MTFLQFLCYLIPGMFIWEIIAGFIRLGLNWYAMRQLKKKFKNAKFVIQNNGDQQWN